MKKRNIIETLAIVSGFLLLIYLLWWRLRLGMVRYFDVDEFAHLHWAHNLLYGQRPYTDFFYLFPPFFLYTLYFLWIIFKNTIAVLFGARILMFLFFTATAWVIYFITSKRLGKIAGIIAAVTFSFLPIPYDKMIEVRPDLPATLFSLLGIYFFIRGIKTEEFGSKNLFLSGIFYGVGIGFVPKTVFFLPPLAITFFFLEIMLIKRKKKFLLKPILDWFSGFFIPVFILIFAITYYGKPVEALLLMTKVAGDASRELVTIYNHSFYMFPSLFFHRNETYYGEGGYNAQYVTNLLTWVFISIWGVVRLVGFYAEEGRERQAGALVIGSSFIFNYWAFVDFFPLKHAQYLISLAPFIAYYFADFAVSLKSKLAENGLVNIFFICLAGIYLVFFTATESMNKNKILWVNTGSLDEIKTLERGLPKGSYVFDLTGESLVFRDPYYICCVPYGQYIRVLPQVPPLAQSLERRSNNYILNNRLDTLPETDRNYVYTHYPIKILSGLVFTK